MGERFIRARRNRRFLKLCDGWLARALRKAYAVVGGKPAPCDPVWPKLGLKYAPEICRGLVDRAPRDGGAA